MSAGGAFGGARGFQPRPPEKGVFPLDHFGECTKVGTPAASRHCWRQACAASSRPAAGLRRGSGAGGAGALPHPFPRGVLCPGATQAQEQYMACLQAHAGDAESCRELAKQYLQCRMER